MSDDQRSREDEFEFRLTIEPEPTGVELVAILQALELLEREKVDSAREAAGNQVWEELARQGGLRARNWPYQSRCWSDVRR